LELVGLRFGELIGQVGLTFIQDVDGKDTGSG